MNHEGMWADLKALAESIERSVGNTEALSYGEDVGEIYRLVQEDIIREGKKSKLRIIRNVLTVMESMEGGYR